MIATPTPRSARRFGLDWIYVRYRTVAWLLALVALAAGGAAAWRWWSGSVPDAERAAAAIASAERAIARARAAGPRLANLELAEHHLEQAKSLAASGSYVLAIDEAAAAEGLARLAARMGAAKSEAVVRVARIEGDVRIKRAGNFLWEEATEQVVLSQGDQIRTGQGGSAQLLAFDGSLVTLSPGTLLEIRELHPAEPKAGGRVSERLAWGRVVAATDDAQPKGTVHEVATDQASVRASGASEFEVQHDRERGRSEVVALRGSVEVETGGERTTVGENTRLAVAQGKIVARDRLLEAPRLLGPPDQRTFLASSLKGLAASWTAVPEADHYHLQLSDGSLFTRLLLDIEHVSATRVDLPPLRTGTYYWRVAAVDHTGREGRWSEVRKFRLAGSEFDDPGDREPPPLEIEELLVVGSNAIVNGRTEPGALVWIDGERVDVAEDGHFNWLIKLRRDGKNTIHFLAQDAAGNETRKVGYAYVDAF